MMRIFFLKLVLYFKHATIKLYRNLSHVGFVGHRTIEAMAWIPGLSHHKTFKLLAETTYFNGSSKQVSGAVAPSNTKSQNLFENKSILIIVRHFVLDACCESWPTCYSVF